MMTISSLLIALNAASIADLDERWRARLSTEAISPLPARAGRGCRECLSPLLAEAFAIEARGGRRAAGGDAAAIGSFRARSRSATGSFLSRNEAASFSWWCPSLCRAPLADDLAFALGTRLRQRIAPLVRIHQAIARDYGGPLDPRCSRLLPGSTARRPSAGGAPVGGHRERRTQTCPLALMALERERSRGGRGPSGELSAAPFTGSTGGPLDARRTAPARHLTWPGVAMREVPIPWPLLLVAPLPWRRPSSPRRSRSGRLSGQRRGRCGCFVASVESSTPFPTAKSRSQGRETARPSNPRGS